MSLWTLLLGRSSRPPVVLDRVPIRGRAGGPRLMPASFETYADAYPPGGPATFHRMQRDSQVRACVMSKKLCILAESVEVRPAEDSASAREAAGAVEAALAGLPGGVCALIEGALDALPMGYAVGELLWNSAGSLRKVFWHDPARFVFLGDLYGEVEGLQILDVPELVLPRDRFVLWSYQSRYGNPYGESDLTAAYRPWALKDALLRFWGVALDKFGSPTVIGKVPPHTAQDDRDSLLATLSALQNQSALVVPLDVEVATLEQGRSEPGAGFRAAADFCNREIAKAILGQTLTIEPGDSGSYGLGRVHQDIFGKWVTALRREVGSVVLTQQVARPITTMLFGPDCPAPIITLPSLTEDEIASRRNLVVALLAGKVIAPEEPWIRSYLDIPASEAVVL